MSAFSNVAGTVPTEYKNLLKKGILVIPIEVFFMDYPKLKEIMYQRIKENVNASDNSLHKYTSPVPINNYDIEGINNILWSFVREFFQLWDTKCPSYHGGFSIIYNSDYELKLDKHVDDSLYTINMCIKSTDVEGSEVVFDNNNAHSSQKYIFVPCKEDYMIIHLGNHTHQTNEITAGERVNIVLWYK